VRVYLTGATGFVGSNLARVLAEQHGAELFCPVRSTEPPTGAPYEWGWIDLTDHGAARRSVADVGPELIVHGAILNDFGRLYKHRREAWDAYVGVTRSLAEAANAAGARLILISTDWVFDGIDGGYAEEDPPNPVNLYGFLKAASELVATSRAERASVARIGAVNGVHWARPHAPRGQDAGFGYFVASLVGALRVGRPFTVWEGPRINSVATPTLASDAAELIWRIGERDLDGIFHCCGGESIDRVGLARRAVEAFELDATLLVVGSPDPRALPPAPIPRDTSLIATATAAALDARLPDLDTTLARFRHQFETGRIASVEEAAAVPTGAGEGGS
jgi:dTDP-4-dehydrorhamnose reductase